MALSWLTVLQNVPWSDVVRNAPAVADGAKKLWKSVARTATSPVAEDATAGEPVAHDADALSVMESRIAALDRNISDLRQEMLASSEVIKALADQNTQLIHRVETMRVRILWLAGGLAVSAVLAAASLFVALAR